MVQHLLMDDRKKMDNDDKWGNCILVDYALDVDGYGRHYRWCNCNTMVVRLARTIILFFVVRMFFLLEMTYGYRCRRWPRVTVMGCK